MKNNQLQATEKDFLQEMIQKSVNESMTHAVEFMYNRLMLLQREQFIGAEAYERSQDRDGYANGFKPLKAKTGAGVLNLDIPQVRNSSSNFRPSILEGLTRSEKALRLAIAEMYFQGVSTRKIKMVMKNLWPDGISSGTVSNIAKELDGHLESFRNRPLKDRYKFIWVDAQYEKVRQDGIVQSFAVLVAMGLNHDRKREIIAASF